MLDIRNQRFGINSSKKEANLLWKVEKPVNNEKPEYPLLCPWEVGYISHAHTNQNQNFTQCGKQHKKARKESTVTHETTRSRLGSPAP